MAIYHMHMKVITRGKGQNTLASASYRSAEKLHDEQLNQTFNFNKREVQPESFILTPAHSPEEFKDRQKLWNSVEQIEKQWNAQLAREFVVALPKELSNEAQRDLMEKFVKEQFVDLGMVADVSIHRDDKNNPHAHVMLTMRPLNENGEWGSKSKKEYILDDNGDFTYSKSGEKRSRKISTTDWDSKERLNIWRKEWANYTNQKLKEHKIDQMIDHRSFRDRGVEKLPTLKMGKSDNAIEKKERIRCAKQGIEYQPITDKGKINALIREYNKMIEKVQENKQNRVSIIQAYIEPALKENVMIDKHYYQFFNDKERLASAYVSQKIAEYNRDFVMPFDKELNPVTLEKSMRGVVAWEHKLERTRNELKEALMENRASQDDVQKFERQYEQFAKVANAYETVQTAFERTAAKKLAWEYNNGALEKLPPAQVNQILTYNHTHLEKLKPNQFEDFLQGQKDILDFKDYANMKTVSLHRAVYYQERLEYRELTIEKDIVSLEKMKRRETSDMTMEEKYNHVKSIAHSQQKIESKSNEIEKAKSLSEKAIDSLYRLEKQELQDKGIDVRLLETVSAQEYVRVSRDVKERNENVLQDVKAEAFKQQAYEYVNRRIYDKEIPEVKFLQEKESDSEIAIGKIESLKSQLERWGESIERKERLSPNLALPKEKKMYEEQYEKVSFVYKEELAKQEKAVQSIDSQFKVDKKSSIEETFKARNQVEQKPSEFVQTERVKSYVSELQEEVPRKPIGQFEDLYRVESKLNEDQRFIDYRKASVQETEDKLNKAEKIYSAIIDKDKKGESTVQEKIQLKQLGYNKDSFPEKREEQKEQIDRSKAFVEKLEGKLNDKKEKFDYAFKDYAVKVEKSFAEAYQHSSKDELSVKEKALILAENRESGRIIEQKEFTAATDKQQTKLNASISLDKIERMEQYFEKKLKPELEKLENAEKKVESTKGIERVKAQQELSVAKTKVNEIHERQEWSYRKEVRQFTEGKWVNGLSKEQSIKAVEHVEQHGQRLPKDEKELGASLQNVVQAIDQAIDEAKRSNQQSGGQKHYTSEADYFYEREKRIQRQTKQSQRGY